MDQEKFIMNEATIKSILKELSKNYLFDDIGFDLKNSCNYGCREALVSQDEIDYYAGDMEYVYDVVILDYGYLYPITDQKESLFTCPKCGKKLQWNSNYTKIICSGQCLAQYTPTQMRRRMKLDRENLENKIMSDLNSYTLPNLARLESGIMAAKKEIIT